MGWSCSVAASRTTDALSAYAEARGFDGSNLVAKDAFFEGDNVEHDDGAITGEVMRMNGSSAGPARIGGDGVIEKMPALDLRDFVKWAEKEARWKQVAALQGIAASRSSPSPRG